MAEKAVMSTASRAPGKAYMPRILERELMDNEEQAIAYAQADFSESNQWYVGHLITDFPDCLGHVIDIGCGPADVLIRLARSKPDVHITAVDGSKAMIKLAQQAVQAAGFQKRIMPIQGYVPGLMLGEHSYDAILATDALHHLPNPMVLWNEAKRLVKRRGAIYIMDLPETAEDAARTVESVAAYEAPILKTTFTIHYALRSLLKK